MGGREWAPGKLHVFLPPCCAGLHICFLSISEIQQELGSQVEIGGPGFTSGMTNVCEEPSDFATQLKFPFGNGHSVFSCFLNSYQPRMQPHTSFSLWKSLYYPFSLFIHSSLQQMLAEYYSVPGTMWSGYMINRTLADFNTSALSRKYKTIAPTFKNVW